MASYTEGYSIVNYLLINELYKDYDDETINKLSSS